MSTVAIFSLASFSLHLGDTIVLSNGNVILQTMTIEDTALGNTNYLNVIGSYANYANPLYHSGQAFNIGVLFLNARIFDALSRNLFSNGVLNFTTDATGRVVSVANVNGSGYKYVYQ